MANAEAVSPQKLGFDPEVLRAKYKKERDKRIRTDGNDQYVEIKGEYSYFEEDPYVTEKLDRAPLSDDTDVIIIGGGFGGLLTGAKLREQGIKDIRIIEKGGDFGGTWYWNRYPGAACDIESYVYLPLLEETGFMPAKRFSEQAEILEHHHRIARHFDLYANACFQTEVTRVDWDDQTARWIVQTNRDDKMTARFVIMSNGPLQKPKLPGIPGIDSYRRHTFHTSRWDYAYTGGNANGNLTGLRDKRVGIIGTGATAVQCVPHLGAASKELYVFQRTPSSIDIRDDRPTDTDWFQAQEPGWHYHRMQNFNILTTGGFAKEDLVNDGWTEIIRNILLIASKEENKGMSPKELAQMAELADFQKMEGVRARAEEIVQDSSVAESLKPYYRQFCKRPCFHNEYLPTFNRPNVHLVDTQGAGVDCITEKGVIANGREFELDCLIFATGFEVGTSYARRAGFEVYGRQGLKQSDKWADGVETMFGIHSHGFPNLYTMAFTQAGFTANYPHGLLEQAIHIAYVIRESMNRQARTVEVSADAEQAWVDEIVKLARINDDFLSGCTPGYYNNEGKVSERSRKNANYGKGSEAYFDRLHEWRDTGDLEGLELTR